MASFADGHVSYTGIHWDSTLLYGGGIRFALAYDSPARPVSRYDDHFIPQNKMPEVTVTLN
jgi:hypothetical protein